MDTQGDDSVSGHPEACSGKARRRFLSMATACAGAGLLGLSPLGAREGPTPVYAAARLSQGPGFQVFAEQNSLEHGPALERFLSDGSFHQTALVLPESAMRMHDARIDEAWHTAANLRHPDKVGLFHRPTLVYGGHVDYQGSVSGGDIGGVTARPRLAFFQLRLPAVRSRNARGPTPHCRVELSVSGSQFKVVRWAALDNTDARWQPRYSRMPGGLPPFSETYATEVTTLSEGEYLGWDVESFGEALENAIASGGWLRVMVHPEHPSSDPDEDSFVPARDPIYEIEYTFAGHPHEEASRYLDAILGQGMRMLAAGQGRHVRNA